MGKRAGPKSSVLIKPLLQHPRRYSFLRAAEVFFASQKSSKGDVRISQAKLDRVLRFRANPSIGFPSADIDSIVETNDNRHEMVVNFMGLYGPASPLPDYFTQAIIDESRDVETLELSTFYLESLKELIAYQEKRLDIVQMRKRARTDKAKLVAKQASKIALNQNQISRLANGETAEEVLSSEQIENMRYKRSLIEINHAPRSNQRDFLDVFNHRLITLYMHSANKYHPYRFMHEGEDYTEKMLLSFMGAPTDDIRASSPIAWRKLLPFVGLLSLQKGSAEAIEKVLSGYFGIDLDKVNVEEHVLRRVDIPKDQLSLTGKQSFTLGSDMVCGARVLDRMSKFRLHISGLTLTTFTQFLPDTEGSLFDELMALLNFVKAPEQLADVCLHLRDDQEAFFALNKQTPTRLGFSAWLNPPKAMSRSVVI